MQVGQEKTGMQTFNQSLASLYFKKAISLDTAMNVSYYPEELVDIVQRREALGIQSGDLTSRSVKKS
jgi:twitching motility protein PilT